MRPLLILACLGVPPLVAGQTPGPGQPASNPAATPATSALLDVGDPAPPLRVAAWLTGSPLAVDTPGGPPVIVVAFWATWSGPSRGALPVLNQLQVDFAARGVVCIGVTDEDAAVVRRFLDSQPPPLALRVALDAEGASRRAYCTAAGVEFLPYAFVLGPDRRVAWHGHPQQPELAATIEALLAGRYDREQARRLVRAARGLDQLEGAFREACAAESWHAALLALDALLERDVPPERLLRYKLAIVLGELEDVPRARALAAELVQRYAGNARFLNSVAWDVVSDPRLYMLAPDVGLQLAQAAHRASRGEDAAVADTYARALHVIGRADLAARVQARAVAQARDGERAAYERTLKFYRQCQALGKQVEEE